MRKFIICISLGALLACEQKKTNVQVTNITEGYQLPYFEDPARAEKILKYKGVIDSIFKTSARINHNPAIAYGIVVDDKLIYSNAVGYANLEKKITADSKSRFRIASMTKSFTAMAILRLRDEGKLQLSDA